MAETFERTIRHLGRNREQLKAEVMAAEEEAKTSLGGPVIRTHRFIRPLGEDCVFIWRLA